VTVTEEDATLTQDARFSTELEELLAAGGSQAGEDLSQDGEGENRRPLRVALAVALSGSGAAIMAGGVFSAASARVYGIVSVLAGVGLALVVRRLRNPLTVNLAVLGGIGAVGLLCLLPTGAANVGHAGALVQSALNDQSVLRPPVTFTPGWHAVLGWLGAALGFAACWLALVVEWPSTGLLLPLPFAAICGISVPQNQQVGSGIAVVGVFAAGLGVLSTSTVSGEADQRPSIGYELRRAGRAVVLIAGLSVALVGLSKAGFLFPKPAYDPAHQAQLPKVAALTTALDRPLFEVRSSTGVTGPWPQGSLDVYDGKAWRLAPVADASYSKVPSSGVVNQELSVGVSADFVIQGYTGAVLPGLPNIVGVAAEGPALQYDHRGDVIRLIEGQVNKGLAYRVAAAGLPTATDLQKDTVPLPPEIKQFTDAPAPPPGVVALIAKLHGSSAFDTFNALRTYVLDNVTSVGAGKPVEVPPSRVEDMVAGSKKGSPFEIVAAQALLARWIGVPSRIGYGFNGGDKVGDHLVVTPRNAATFVEVYFPRFGWLPVIGNPKKAQASDSNSDQQQKTSDVQASDNFGATLFLPTVTPAPSTTAQNTLLALLIAAGAAGLGYLGWLLTPLLVKARRRGRLRAAAAAAGPRSRIALAYAEWRDTATDHGYRHDADPPLAYLLRFAPDPEHAELAWLVTRAIWGDLRDAVTDDMAAAAEELSRALRRRLSNAHPVSVRVLSAMSRLSLRHPFSPELNDSLLQPTKEVARAQVLAPQPA
jgi:hypothetical protein